MNGSKHTNFSLSKRLIERENLKWYGEQYMKKSQPDITQSNNVNSGEAGLDTYIPPAGGGGTTSTKFTVDIKNTKLDKAYPVNITQTEEFHAFFEKLEGWKK